MGNVDRELAALVLEAPLSPRWKAPQPFEQVVEIGGLGLHLLGLVAAAEAGVDVVGSAAEVAAFPLRRAYFELLERSAVLDVLARPADAYPLLDAAGNRLGECPGATAFPDAGSAPWAYSKSNGVAVGPDWPSACAAALAELFERHCVLNAWYGFAQPSKLGAPADASFELLKQWYDVECYRFPSPSEQSLEVAGVFGFPKEGEAPLMYGFGAGRTGAGALERAGRECLQRLAFLWGEEIPSAEPAFSKTPDYHQEMFLRPAMREPLRSWLAGEHAGRATLSSASQAPRVPSFEAECGFIDLTPPHLVTATGVYPRVAKAISNSAVPLTFGRGHPWFESNEPSLAVHPIA